MQPSNFTPIRIANNYDEHRTLVRADYAGDTLVYFDEFNCAFERYPDLSDVATFEQLSCGDRWEEER